MQINERIIIRDRTSRDSVFVAPSVRNAADTTAFYYSCYSNTVADILANVKKLIFAANSPKMIQLAKRITETTEALQVVTNGCEFLTNAYEFLTKLTIT